MFIRASISLGRTLPPQNHLAHQVAMLRAGIARARLLGARASTTLPAAPTVVTPPAKGPPASSRVSAAALNLREAQQFIMNSQQAPRAVKRPARPAKPQR